MVSHFSAGGLELSFGKGGLRFKKKAGAGQRCVGGHMKGQTHSQLGRGEGGRHDVAFQAKFYDAAVGCGFNVKKPRPGSGPTGAKAPRLAVPRA